MTARRTISRIMLAAAALALVGVAGLYLYVLPRQRLVRQIEAQRQRNAGYEMAQRDHPRLRESLRAHARRTLHADPDQAVHLFRTALGELATDCGLQGVQVSTREPEPMPNPGGRRLRALQGRSDFHVIRGEVSGTGTLEQALRTLAQLQVQPWIARLEGFTLKPEGRERERFALRAGVATLLMPDLTPADLPAPRVVPEDPAAAARWAGIVEKNVFREPPLRVARADAPPPAQPPPRSLLGEWKITGIIETRRGVEVLVLNTRTREAVVLTIGNTVAGATLTAAARDAATFDLAGKRVEVLIGQTLEQGRTLGP